MGPLDGALAKLGRSEEHFNDLTAKIRDWSSNDPYSFVSDDHGTRTHHSIYAKENVKPDLVSWGLITGDCVHNLRCALDHLVWVASGDRGNTRTEFPIFTDEAMFRSEGNRGGLRKIAGIEDPRIRALIEKAQPWSRNPNAPDNDPLAIVHRLDIDDKHRSLALAAMVLRSLRATFKMLPENGIAGGIGEPAVIPTGGPVEDGAELFVVVLPNPGGVQMQASLAFGVGIPLPSGGNRGSVTAVLGKCCKHVRGIVEEIGNLLV